MKHQKQPNRWSCVPTAFANLLDMDVNYIIKQIGHDGSDILFPELSEPLCRRGFHPQEVLFALLKEDIYFTVFDKKLSLMNKDGITFSINHDKKLMRAMENRNGVLTGDINNQNHCVTWRFNLIYDPNGTTYPLERFNIDSAYLLVP